MRICTCRFRFYLYCPTSPIDFFMHLCLVSTCNKLYNIHAGLFNRQLNLTLTLLFRFDTESPWYDESTLHLFQEEVIQENGVMNDLCNWQPYGDVCYWWPRHVLTTPPHPPHPLVTARDTDCENRRPHGSAPLSHPIIKPSPDSIDFNRVGNHYSSNCQIKAKIEAITCVLTVYNWHEEIPIPHTTCFNGAMPLFWS